MKQNEIEKSQIFLLISAITYLLGVPTIFSDKYSFLVGSLAFIISSYVAYKFFVFKNFVLSSTFVFVSFLINPILIIVFNPKNFSIIYLFLSIVVFGLCLAINKANIKQILYVILGVLTALIFGYLYILINPVYPSNSLNHELFTWRKI